jgi:hypothetical protein
LGIGGGLFDTEAIRTFEESEASRSISGCIVGQDEPTSEADGGGNHQRPRTPDLNIYNLPRQSYVIEPLIRPC